GTTTDWTFTTGSATTLADRGITKVGPKALKIGEPLTAKFIPAINGAPLGFLKSVTRADGQTLNISHGAASDSSTHWSATSIVRAPTIECCGSGPLERVASARVALSFFGPVRECRKRPKSRSLETGGALPWSHEVREDVLGFRLAGSLPGLV